MSKIPVRLSSSSPFRLNSALPARSSAKKRESMTLTRLVTGRTQTPKETGSPASNGANGEANLASVNEKLKNLTMEPQAMSGEDRLATLDNPFDDDEEEDEPDLSEYTEEEIGSVAALTGSIETWG